MQLQTLKFYLFILVFLILLKFATLAVFSQTRTPLCAPQTNTLESAWYPPINCTLPDTIQFCYLNFEVGCSSNFCKRITLDTFNFSIPATATILSISLLVERKASNSGSIKDDFVFLTLKKQTGVNAADKNFWSLNWESIFYPDNTTIPPLWGSTWLPSDINDPQFGVIIQMHILGNATAYYSCFEITVDYYLNPEITTDQINTTVSTTNQACPSACSNHGSCLNNYTCQCDNGWLGDSCNQAICSSGCNGHGSCISPDICLCNSEWYGNNCENNLNQNEAKTNLAWLFLLLGVSAGSLVVGAALSITCYIARKKVNAQKTGSTNQEIENGNDRASGNTQPLPPPIPPNTIWRQVSSVADWA